MLSTVRRIAAGIPIVPVVALLVSAGVIAYALRSSTSDSPIVAAPTPTPFYPKGAPVIFNSIIDPSGTQYLPAISEPTDTYTAANPVTVAVAIGGGLVYQKESEAPQYGYGHLHILIDANVPDPAQTVISDDRHIDLANGEHTATLPTLSPGQHRISAVWTDSQNKATYPVAYATVTINVPPPSS